MTGNSPSSWGGGGLNSLKAWSQKRGQTGGSSKLATSATTATSTSTAASNSSLLDGFGGGGGLSGPGENADEDASVRVLPGSRRNSEDSLGGKSTWSAMVPHQVGPSSGTGGPAPVSGGGASRKSIVSVKVGDYDQEEAVARDRRRSSLRTVETGETGNREKTSERDADEEAVDNGTEEALEAGEGGQQETEAQGVKKRAEERNHGNGKGKGVDQEEHEGVKELALPVPIATLASTESEGTH